MTIILSTILTQWKHSWIEKHITDHYQWWNSFSSTLLKQCGVMLIENKTKTSQLKKKKKRFEMSFNKPGALLYLWRLLILPRVQTSHSPAHILLANDNTLRGGSRFLHNTEIVYACKSVDRIQLIKKILTIKLYYSRKQSSRKKPWQQHRKLFALHNRRWQQ